MHSRCEKRALRVHVLLGGQDDGLVGLAEVVQLLDELRIAPVELLLGPAGAGQRLLHCGGLVGLLFAAQIQDPVDLRGVLRACGLEAPEVLLEIMSLLGLRACGG